MRIYVEPSYDKGQVYSLIPYLLLLADSVVLYGAIEPQIQFRRNGEIDDQLTRLHRDMFRAFVREKRCAIVVRNAWYQKDTRLAMIDAERSKPRPLWWDDPATDLESYWSETDQALREKADHINKGDLACPSHHLGQSDAPLILLPDDFTDVGDQFAERCLAEESKELAVLPWCVGAWLKDKEFGDNAPKDGDPLCQHISNFVNDLVAMAAANATLAWTPPDVGMAMNETRVVFDKTADKAIADAQFAKELLLDGIKLDKEARASLKSVEPKLTCEDDIAKILALRDLPQFKKLREWLDGFCQSRGAWFLSPGDTEELKSAVEQLVGPGTPDWLGAWSTALGAMLTSMAANQAGITEDIGENWAEFMHAFALLGGAWCGFQFARPLVDWIIRGQQRDGLARLESMLLTPRA